MNSPENNTSLENPRIAIYSHSLEGINSNILVRIKGVGYKVKLTEVSHNFSKDLMQSSTLKEEHPRATIDSSSLEYCPSNKEELIVEDREVVEYKEEEDLADPSLISRVSDSQEGLKIKEKKYHQVRIRLSRRACVRIFQILLTKRTVPS